jgi:uncharacterized protein YprB with RNaseH-like and TPR domain
LLSNTFVHLPDIGPVTEREIWDSGVHTWEDFLSASSLPARAERNVGQLRELVSESKDRLDALDAAYFSDVLPNNEMWRLYAEFRDRAAFVDIETTGLSPDTADITMVGVLDFQGYRAFVRDENLEDLRGALEEYDLMVTFNGAAFDLPFIEHKLGRMFAQVAHIDLMFPLRRMGLKGGLKAIEKRLNVGRPSALSTLTGFDAVLMWRMWRNGDKAARDTLVRYNAEDVLSLPKLAEIVYDGLADRLDVPCAKLEPSDLPDITLPFDEDVIGRLAEMRVSR